MTEHEEHVVAGALRALEEKGRLTPDAVVEAAKDPDSPLHEHFEWDDDKAGYHWRLQQGRQLIRTVRVDVEIEDETVSTFRYVRDPTVEYREQGYVTLEQLREEPENTREMLLWEFQRVETCLSRAEGLCVAMGAAKSEVASLRRRVAKSKRRVSKLVPATV